jgi:hypothetical protein
MDSQDIGDIAHEDRLQFTVERKNDCDLSKEIGYNSSIPADSILEEKVNQRDHMEPSNTEENYSTVSIRFRIDTFVAIGVSCKIYIG